jgi:hypothetical protein
MNTIGFVWLTSPQISGVHPVGYQVAELFETHDRERFSILGAPRLVLETLCCNNLVKYAFREDFERETG